jgi:hypothetical protein
LKGGEERARMRLILSSASFALFLLSAGIPAGPGPLARAGDTIGGTECPKDIILSPAEREEILRGRVVLRNIAEPKRKGRTYEAIGILQGSLEDNFEVITNYRSYPEFQPRVAKASVRDESASVAVVEITLKLPLGITRKFRLRYSAKKGEEGFLVSWQKLPWPELKPSQTVVDTSGYWLVKKFDAGGLLAVTRAYLDPGSVPFGLTGIVNALSKQSLPGMIRSVRRRVKGLNGPGFDVMFGKSIGARAQGKFGPNYINISEFAAKVCSFLLSKWA